MPSRCRGSDEAHALEVYSRRGGRFPANGYRSASSTTVTHCQMGLPLFRSERGRVVWTRGKSYCTVGEGAISGITSKTQDFKFLSHHPK